MEYARDLAEQMQRDGKGRVLDQFANADNPHVHFETTGPEIWRRHRRARHALRQRDGHHRHHHRRVALPEGAQPGGAHHRRAAGRGLAHPRHPQVAEAYLPKIYDATHVDELVLVSQADAEDMARRLAREEGLFAGISAAGACWVALQIARAGDATPPSSSSSATAATATCRPASFRPDRACRRSTGAASGTWLRRSACRDDVQCYRFCPLRHRTAPSSDRGQRPEDGACAARPAAGRTGTTRRRCWPR